MQIYLFEMYRSDEYICDIIKTQFCIKLYKCGCVDKQWNVKHISTEILLNN